MDSAKEFGSCLEVLEAHEDQKYFLESRVSIAIFNEERVLCGLKNGDLHLIRMDQDIAKFESSAPRKEVTCLAWVGSDKCVSGHTDGPSRLWDLTELKEIAIFEAGDREAEEFDRAVAVDTDGRAVLASSIGFLRLWDLDKIQQIARVKAHDNEIFNVCIVDDTCISDAEDFTWKVWDLSSLQSLHVFPKKYNEEGILEITEDGKCLFSNWNFIVFWDCSENKEISRYKGHRNKVACMKEIYDDRCVSCAVGEGKLRMWSLKDLSDIHQFPVQANYLKVQKNLLYCATQYGLSVVNLLTSEIIATVDLKMMISFVHYFEGQCICIPDFESCVCVLKVDQYQQMHELFGHENTVNDTLVWGADKLISWSWDRTLRVWDVNQYRELAVLEGHSANVVCAALTADDRCISGDSKGYLKVWDLSNMTEVPTNMKHPDRVNCVIVTTNGKAIAADDQFNVFVWDLTDYSKIGELNGHTDKLCRLLLVSDEIVISGSWDKTVRVWNLQNCSVLATLEGHQKAIIWIELASENRCLSASDDKTLKVWDLHTYALLATLQGHTDSLWVVVASNEKCASGSKDKTIIIWNLNTYLQEAILTCISEVGWLIFINNNQLVSGELGGEVEVWEDYRKIASFKGNSDTISSVTLLSNSRLATPTYRYNQVQIWDFGELSSCLSMCNNREILQKEISEMKPLFPQYRSRIGDFKSGKRVPQPECSMLFRPYFFNALHLCAYYNHPELLSEYLQEGIPLLRGALGSPLTLALKRKTVRCVDVILDYLISVASNEHAWKSFQTINDELAILLSCGSSKLEAFCSVLLQSSTQQVPSFINPTVPLPIRLFAPQTNIFHLGIFKPGEAGEDLVKFCVSLVHWNYISGSQDSINMLNAAVNCEDKRILSSHYFRAIIEQKWTNCYPFTLSVTIAYVAMLVCLIGIVDFHLEECCIGYLVLNAFFFSYELSQLIAMRTEYFTEGWNIVDFTRCILSISWISLILAGFKVEKHVTLLVVLLDFIRGFTHFRSFRMTRIFVYMTFTVVAEMYSFLLILAYTIFAFGFFTSVLIGESSLSETWKKAYNMAMGNFDTSNYSTLEWVVFTGATVTNVVIMMNLLISILGEAYEKAQMTMLENDLHMQASLLLEYETLMVWRRSKVSKTWVVTCRKADEGNEQMEWSGKVLQIVNSLTEGLSQIKEEISGKIGIIERKMKPIDNIQSKVIGIEEKFQGIEGKFQGIEGKFQGIDDLKAKVLGIEEKIDTVLTLLQSRS